MLVLAMGFSDFKNTFLEVLWIARNTLNTFWFWLPIIFMGYVFFQLWLMFYVHPLALAILPIILIIYGIQNEEKRIRAKYGLTKMKYLSATHGFGAKPEPIKKREWEVEQAVKRYKKLLKDKKTKKG